MDLAELAELGAAATALLAAETRDKTQSAEHARKAGEVFKRAWNLTAPERRWYDWLKEHHIHPTRAQDRIRIFDSWGALPTDTVGNGVEACIKFLRNGAAPEGGDDVQATAAALPPFRMWEELERIGDYLLARWREWPDEPRPHFWKLVRNMLDNMEVEYDEGGGGTDSTLASPDPD